MGKKGVTQNSLSGSCQIIYATMHKYMSSYGIFDLQNFCGIFLFALWMKNQIAIHVKHTWCYSLSEFWARAAFVSLFLLPIWQLLRLHY